MEITVLPKNLKTIDDIFRSALVSVKEAIDSIEQEGPLTETKPSIALLKSSVDKIQELIKQLSTDAQTINIACACDRVKIIPLHTNF